MKSFEEKLSSRVPEHCSQSNVLITKSQLISGIQSLATKLNKDYLVDDPIFLCVVSGAIVFTGQLLPLLDFPLVLDYVHVSRYKDNKAGELIWKHYPNKELQGRNIVLIDDILDSGITLSAIRDWCFEKGASKVESVVLLEKELKRKEGLIQQANYAAFKIGGEFVYGFGLDNDDYWRNTSQVHFVSEAE